MTNRERLQWFLAGFTVAMAVCQLLIIAVAYAKSLNSVQAAVLSLVPAYEDRNVDPEVKRRQLETVASVIAAVTTNRNERALLITIGWWETKFAIRLGENRCKPHECDGGNARHYFQAHQHKLPDAEWNAMVGTGVEPTTIAAKHALRIIRGAYHMCRGEPDPVRATIAAYGSGRGCRGELKDLNERKATYERVLRRL